MQSRQYGRDVLAPENRTPRPGQGPVPQVEAERGPRGRGLRGTVLRRGRRGRAGSVTLEDRFGKRRVFPLPGAFLLDGKRVTLVRPRRDAARRRSRSAGPRPGRSPPRSSGPRSPGPAGSTSRASTTPSWWRRSGATTCATSASSWSTWRASTTCRAIVRDFEPGRRPAARRARRPPGRAGPRRAGSPPPSATTRTCSSSATRSSTSGRPSSPPRSAWRRGRTCRAGSPGRKACWRRLGWPHETHAGRRGRLAAHPAFGRQLRGPGAGTARPGRGAHRLRDRADDRRASRSSGVRSRITASARRRPAQGQHEPPGRRRRSGRGVQSRASVRSRQGGGAEQGQRQALGQPQRGA